jgi:probable F420-dependent oxidoreductase
VGPVPDRYGPMTSSIPRLILALPPAFHPTAGPETALATAVGAERAGFSGVAVTDHVVMGEGRDYPWGALPSPAHGPWLEPLTLLAAIGAATTKLRLCTAILIAPLRPAALLAKMAATVDRLCQGRLELACGTGWQRKEFDAVGVPFDRRAAVLRETLLACRQLWSQSPASFDGEFVHITDAWCEPKPLRRGGPPVVLAGSVSEPNLKRMACLGDGWITPVVYDLARLSSDAGAVQDAWRDAGRGEHPMIWARLPAPTGRELHQGLAGALEQLRQFRRCGVTDALIPLRDFADHVADLDDFFASAARLMEHQDKEVQ